ncbi:cell wall-active antibiotics response protein LiaF [Heyndrickxia sp. NPDC080065]|uniref:cell wall-active antibiotics response protein LiaF n=1 Tax=Heyndrickxia sp. NPDC080065 TaxID=3390568 RepID=UPI003D068892
MLFSVVLLLVGIALLLINVGVISLEIKEFFVMFIPIVFVIVGIWYIIKSIRKKSSGNIFLALLFSTYGALLILSQQKVIHFSFGDWWKLWPIFLIYLAIDQLFFKGKGKVVVNFDSKEDVKVYKINLKDTAKKNLEKNIKMNMKNLGDGIKSNLISSESKIKENIKKNLSVSDVHFNEQNWPLKPMDIHTTIGDFYLDFSKAFIPEEETSVKIKSRIGDVKMLIPEDIPVRIDAKTKVGDIRLFDLKSSETKPHLFFESPDYEEGIKKIDIMIEIGIGSIRIDRV